MRSPGGACVSKCWLPKQETLAQVRQPRAVAGHCAGRTCSWPKSVRWPRVQWPVLSWSRIANDARRAGAEGPLCPRPHHHHRADRAAGKRGRVRLHGAALEPGDAAAVGGHGARHRRGHRHLREQRVQRRHRQAGRDGAEPVRPVDRGAAAGRPADHPAQAVLRSARPRAVGRDAQPRQAPVLDRHGRPDAARGDPRQARQRHPALHRPARADLRLQLAHLPDVDGRHVGGAADRRHPVPAQPDPPDPAAGRGGRRVRQGPARAARLPPARRPRGAPGGARPSWRCAIASATTSTSAPPCWPASATTCAPS